MNNDTKELRDWWHDLLADAVSDESWRREEYLNFQVAKANKITRDDLERIFQNTAKWQAPIIIHPEGTA